MKNKLDPLQIIFWEEFLSYLFNICEMILKVILNIIPSSSLCIMTSLQLSIFFTNGRSNDEILSSTSSLKKRLWNDSWKWFSAVRGSRRIFQDPFKRIFSIRTCPVLKKVEISGNTSRSKKEWKEFLKIHPSIKTNI